MNILYSCFAISPYRGSEAICAWNTVISMATKASVIVLTRTNNRDEIEKYFLENSCDNLDIKFLYCDDNFFYKLYRKNSKFYYIYYLKWQKKAYKFLKKSDVIDNVDIIHHISLGDFRVVGCLWKLKKAFFFGPVGGGQKTPKCFRHKMRKYKVSEGIRSFANHLFIKRIKYRKCVKNTKVILCANRETEKYICKYYNYANTMIVSENGLNYDHSLEVVKKKNEKLRYLWCGRLIYRKGLEFLLEAISVVDKNISLDIYGDGPLKDILLKQIKLNDLSNCRILKPVSHAEIQEKYKLYDVFIFPSIRETTGTVIFEAMMNKLPVIAFDAYGASIVLNNKELLVPFFDDYDSTFNAFCDVLRGVNEGKYDLVAIANDNFKNALKMDWNVKTDLYLTLYKEAINEKK